MAEAAQTIETVEITTAVRSVQIDGIEVQEGEVIGLVNGKLVSMASHQPRLPPSVSARWRAMTMRSLPFTMANRSRPMRPRPWPRIDGRNPDQEIEVVDGGQPHYHYILSAE